MDFKDTAVNGWPFLYHWTDGEGLPSAEQCNKKRGPTAVTYGLLDGVMWTIGASMKLNYWLYTGSSNYVYTYMTQSVKDRTYLHIKDLPNDLVFNGMY